MAYRSRRTGGRTRSAAGSTRRRSNAPRTRVRATGRGRRTSVRRVSAPRGQTVRLVIEQATPTATHRPSYLSSLNPAIVENARKRLAKL